MRKQLGGDRLGSGNKLSVDLHNYNRSTHDLGYIWRSTMAPGTLVPFLSKIALPGDTWDINLNAIVKTLPTIGPLFGSYKLQLDIFECPVRLYQGQLHNNKLRIGMQMQNVKLPLMEMTATFVPLDHPDIDNAQINPSCIHKYLGLSGVGLITEGDTENKRLFNALKLLAYWDTYKNYYANKQEEIGAVVHTPLDAIVATVDEIQLDSDVLPQAPTAASIVMNGPLPIDVFYTGATPDPSQIIFNITPGGKRSLQELCSTIIDNGTQLNCIFDFATWGTLTFITWDYLDNTTIPVGPPKVATFPLDNLDEMREYILENVNLAEPVVINNADLTPYKWVLDFVNERSPYLNPLEGLAIKTYQSDQFNNWIATDWIDGPAGINEITAVSTVGDKFTIDQLRFANKVNEMLNRIAVSGGSYDDWIEAVYTPINYRRCETPMYMGGLSKEVIFQEVISNAQASSDGSGTQPLGTLAGRGNLSNKHKGGRVRIKTQEISYILGIVSLTPRIDYSQGNDFDMEFATMNDFHKPALDEIGFQDLDEELLAWWTTTKAAGVAPWEKKFAGKQPAWLDYMTAVNKTYGDFAIATNSMFMTLNRRYERDAGDILDLTTYIDPVKGNQIFAQTSITAQNFWVQLGVDIECRRVMSAKLMPSL